jgi:predicted nucleic acid-binding protein
MLLIDANIFLELMLDQARADECERLLTAVEEGTREAIITDLILDSVLIVMENKGKGPSELATFISSIATYKGLRLYWLSLVDRLHATVHMSRMGLDFEDSTTFEAGRRLSVEGIVSFDADFDGLSEIRRLEPRDLFPPNS